MKKTNPIFSLKNFRSFGEEGADFELAPITVLTGCNSGGKSSLVKALMLLSEQTTGQKVNKGMIDDKRYQPSTILKTSSAELKLGGFSNVINEQAKNGILTISSSNPQPIGFSGILLAKRQNSFYCTYFLHNRNVADTKSPYPIKRLEVIRWFNQKSMVFNQSLS